MSRWALFLAAVFVAALGWRLAYLDRLAHTPLAGALVADARLYWHWAGLISQHGWLGSQPFFLGPIYPYTLALLRVLMADSIERILIVQAVWGALAVVLLTDAARRIAGTAAAVVIGGILCCYQMAVLFDGLMLMESLLFFLEALLLWLLARSRWESVVPGWFVLPGVVIGLLAEGRATSGLLLAPLGAALLSVPHPHRWRAFAAALGGFALVVTPVAVRNYAVGREWIPFTYNLGYNLYVGNNPEATGASVPIAGTYLGQTYGRGLDGGGEIDGRAYLRRTEGQALSPAASSRYWAAKATRYMSQHALQSGRLAVRKLGMFWNRREYPQIESLREVRALAGPLGPPLVGEFLALGALALAGLWFAWAMGSAGRFVAGYVVVMSAAILPFFVTDRYRLHLVPAAALLAAIAIARLTRAVREADWSRRARVGLALLSGIVVVLLPSPHASGPTARWIVATDRANLFLMQGRPELAVRELRRAQALDAGSGIDLGGAMTTHAGRADYYFAYASAEQALGHPAEHLRWLERAAREAPDHPVVVRALGDAYFASGQAPRADSVYARLDSLPGGEGLSAASRGWQAARAGRIEAAEQWFTRSVSRAPHLDEAWGALIRTQAQLGRLDDATRSLRLARAAGLASPSRNAHEALIAAVRHDRVAAVRALDRVPDAALRADPTLADVATVTRRMIAGGP